MDLKEIEKLELEYLEQLFFTFNSNVNLIVSQLNSKNKIYSDWINIFNRINKRHQNGIISRGAERVFYSIMPKNWIVNSSPIGADLFYETYNAYIHLDVKTAKIDNKGDYKGLIPVGKNQTSYNPSKSNSGTPIKGSPNLPSFYSDGKICLSYGIQIIYSLDGKDTIAILIISIPNGKLFRTYGNKIANAGKTKNESFRYVYHRSPYFKHINKVHRFRIVHFNEKFGFQLKDILNISDLNS